MRRHSKPTITHGLITALLGCVLFVSPWGAMLERSVGLRWLFQTRGPISPPPGVFVVSLDKSSSEAFGLRYEPRDWPRTLHAQLIEGLHRAGAYATVFDLFFREARKGEDEALIAAMQAAGNVVLLEFLEKCEVSLSAPGANVPSQGDRVTECRPGSRGSGQAGKSAAIHRLLLPEERIKKAAAATAPFTLPDASGPVLQFWTRDGNAGDAPSLPLMALLVAYRSHHSGLERSAATPLASAGPAALPLSVLRAPKEWDEIALQAGIDEHSPFGEGLAHALRAPTSRHLNFYGPPWTVRTISYRDALTALTRGETGPAHDHGWRGSVVFVGVSSPVQWEQRDDFKTPLSDSKTGLDLSGVEILATAFANLRDGTFLHPLSTWASVGLLFGWAMLIAAIDRLRRLSVVVLTIVSLGVAYFLLSLLLFGTQQVWIPTAIPLLAQIPMMLGVSGVSRYLKLDRDRKRIREVFSYYLPEPVVERLVREGRHPSSDHEELFGVCLYSDAVSYTTLAEGMPPSQLAETMNAYYQLLFEPVRRHGGIVCDVVGDAMVAIWPALKDDIGVREAACRAALEIQAALDAGSQEVPALPTRIGLHAGAMAMAHLGAVDHYAYRAVGDIVNVAARLEALSKDLGTRLLVSSDMLAGLDAAVSRRLGGFVLRGRRAPLDVCELLGWGGESRRCFDALCRQTVAGVDATEQGKLEMAEACFRSLLLAYPNDGPGAYLLRSVRQALSRAPPSG